MDQLHARSVSPLLAVSNAMVALHKEQFGRGPTKARAYFAGPDALVCVLHHALLPAEHKLIELGEVGRVRDSRTVFQAATAPDFTRAVEAILGRRVRAFASGIDPEHDTVFENFEFEPQAADGDRLTTPAGASASSDGTALRT